jgi:hypothetical protein
MSSSDGVTDAATFQANASKEEGRSRLVKRGVPEKGTERLWGGESLCRT